MEESELSKSTISEYFRKHQGIRNQLNRLKDGSFASTTININSKFLTSFCNELSEHNFIAYEQFGDEPKVIIIGDHHKDSRNSDFLDDIASILRETLVWRDVVLLEGSDGRRVEDVTGYTAMPTTAGSGRGGASEPGFFRAALTRKSVRSLIV